jgi:non-heme chloroperoxidase
MPFIETRDGATLFYRDWGTGRPVLFLSAWGLDSTEPRGPMLHLTEHGLRALSLDRRGHGRSDDPGRGHDYDSLADDVAELIDRLDLQEVTLVGHSMGGGEAVRYLTRHGNDRISRLVLVAAAIPSVRQAPDNPDGVPLAATAQVHSEWRTDFGRWLTDNADAYLGSGLPGCEVSEPARVHVFETMMSVSPKAIEECNRAVLEADFRAELPRLTVPTLIIHGDHDASIPVRHGRTQAALIPGSELVIYENAPHGLYLTHPGRLAGDILTFATAAAVTTA